MGYEVLDADGSGRAVTPVPGAAAEVVALEDLPDPRAGLDEAPRPARQAPVWLARRLPEVRRSQGASTPSRPWRLLAGLCAACAVAGVIVGMVWSGHHASQVRLAEARGAVSAFATLVSANRVPTSQGPAADLSVRVYNVGSSPLKLVTTPRDARLTFTSPEVSISSGTDTVKPNTSETVTTRILLDCDKTDALQATVPVAPPDGTVHQLAVANDESQPLPVPAELCNERPGQYQTLDVNLGGTLAHPLLRLQNATTRDVTASWAFEGGSGGFGPDRRDVQLTSDPALPLILGPHEARTVALNVVVRSCGADKPLEEYTSLGFVNLHVQFTDGWQEPDYGADGVDLSAIVGAAVQRACG
jgi:hypothetical protein